MGKLALIGAILGIGATSANAAIPVTTIRTVTYPGQAPVTVREAKQALSDGAWAWADRQGHISCAAKNRDQLCQTSDSTTYVDAVFGPSVIVGITTFLVSRYGNDYRVQVVVPDHFEIYAG